MGVYIKGMKIPKKCLWCPLQYIGFCQVTKTDVNSDLGRRADDCPIVEVPEPHGRLVDETIILEMIRKSMGIKDLSFLYHAEKSVVNEIFHAPTVIEAEGE